MAEAPSGPGLGRAACLVTGASRGFGRSVAGLLAARLAPGSLLLLVARSAGALGELEGELRAAYPELRVQALPADLGADEGLQRVARDAADALRRHHNSARLQRLLLVNNAGPLDTEMQEEARTRSGDPSLRQMFLHMKEKGQLLDCEVSAQKLLDLLLTDAFESGAHVDFFDL